ncbi:Ppx/GppA family phosphatase [Parashewanella curva]|uniref:Ppx/GppA family phosphatase n=1 Tax=Parashewanella curva TaxID=2338552 RepID=A0A3L8PW38_9GAMM|nr:Ppx/GppA phosphatase family protein [Parashewanella curva]RLV59009.1 Ppx/GppA family phosphatase [Parashewanella curva]
MSRQICAITLGSNSFNMLVAEVKSDHPVVVAKYKQKVRLADGINGDGHLEQDAFERGIACLKYFAEQIKQHPLCDQDIKIIATATLRQVTNQQAFIDQAFKVLPTQIQVISGDEEAEYIYQGMWHTTQGDDRRLVIDIGGASTEFVVGDTHNILFKVSKPIGCVSLHHPYFSHFPYRNSDFEAVVKQVNVQLADCLVRLKNYGCHKAVGASGTVQTLMELLKHRAQHQKITAEFLEQIKAEILNESCHKLSNIAGLSQERAPTLAAGVAILLALFKLLDLNAVHLSGGALREGVLYSMI